MRKILFLILVVAAILRLWDLGGTPIHLTNDEAALGYNAYSILKTGRDEHGAFLPTIFKSFGDWKPGLYVYAAVPGIALFGLNEFAVRFPGAVFGILAVWLVYLVVKELFPQQNNFSLGEIAALFLAISPWHIHFSRGAWEAGLSLTFTLAGIYFFLRAVKRKDWWFVLSSFFFSLSLITYQGAKLSTGIVILGLLIFWRSELRGVRKRFMIGAVLIILLMFLPFVLNVNSGSANRLEVFSVFSYPRPPSLVEHISTQGGEPRFSLPFILFHSESLNFVRGILGRWTNHYSTRFLFFEGDWAHINASAPNSGTLLFVSIIFIVAGAIYLMRLKKQSVMFVAYWLLFAPLPAALSRDPISAIRSINLVVPLTIIIACGVIFLIGKLRNSKFTLVCLTILCALNFTYWADAYFIHLNSHNAKSWQYGYRQVVEKITPIQKNYKQIVFVQSYDQPYIFFLFYQKYDPSKYQSENHLVPGNNPLDVGFVERLDNLSFEQIDWPSHRGRRGVLFIGNTEQIPPKDSVDPSLFKLIDEIKYPDGNTAFRLVEIL